MSTHLTTQAFQTQVFDFTGGSEWSYVGDLPCVVDFWAEWCPPCRMISPIIDDLSREYEGRVRFYKVNTDEEPDIADALGILSVPCLLFVPVIGKPQMSVGALPKEGLKRVIDRELLPGS